jgi:hypothetical protein
MEGRAERRAAVRRADQRGSTDAGTVGLPEGTISAREAVIRSAACLSSGIWRGSEERPASGTPSTQVVWTKASTTIGSNCHAGELAQLRHRLVGRERLHPVRACRRHGLEGVGHVEDPGELGDLVADEAIGVPRTVVPLVVVPDDRQLRGQLRDRGDDVGAMTGWAFMISARRASGAPPS